MRYYWYSVQPGAWQINMKCSRVHLWPVSLFWGCFFGSKPVKGPKSSQQNRKFTWIAKVIPYPIGIIPHITPHPHTVDESIHRIDPRRHWSRRHLAKHEKSASHLPPTGKNPMEIEWKLPSHPIWSEKKTMVFCRFSQVHHLECICFLLPKSA